MPAELCIVKDGFLSTPAVSHIRSAPGRPVFQDFYYDEDVKPFFDFDTNEFDTNKRLREYFERVLVQLANDDRDIDLYHWSSARFSAAWIDTISVLLAKGRARVGVADAATDWPRRIRDMQYLDHESLEAGA